ncbi:MAG: hypothetical protein GX456_19535 [Verrucomicrobia bacterium]|nr:hypothetical protein [Verrucomicrobiota bacterium]
MASFDLAVDPDAFSRAAADALGVGRRETFGCGSLLPLCFYARTTCLSPYPVFPISPMTGHATRFDPTNRATEHTPVGCGEESPRSCRRVRRNTDGCERGRPRPHQPDARSYTGFVHANPTPERSPAGGGQECPRSCSAFEKAVAPGARPSSAASTRRPILHRFRSRKPDARTFTGLGCRNNVPVPISA